MNRKNKLEKAAKVLKAVAHPVRIEIINLLSRHKQLSVGEITSKLKITQSMTSQHLNSLKNIGILGSEKKANVCLYFIENKNVLKLLNCVNHCTG